MPRTMQPARFAGTNVPNTQSMKYATGQTFLQGAILIFSSGEVVEGGANPTGIVGIAGEKAGSKPGYDAANSPATFTGRVQEASVWRANRMTIFSSHLVNNSATAVTAAQADVGASYGVAKHSGTWYVDKNLTAGDARTALEDFDADLNIVFFKFLEANLATP